MKEPANKYHMDGPSVPGHPITMDRADAGGRKQSQWFLHHLKTSLFGRTCTYPANSEIRLYRRRFWMLFLYSASSFLNCLLYIQYSIISNIVECYYGVSPYSVNWTSTIYMVIYFVLVIPISWFIDNFNLKVTVVLGAFINCLCTTIQCFSLHRNNFPVVMIAQTLAAISDVLILPIPPKLAAVWFGPHEVCRATAIGVFGNQFGMALGNILPPLVVPNDCTKPEAIRHGFGILAYSLTGANAIILILCLLTFEGKPPLPPSEVSRSVEKIDYKKSLIRLCKNFNFYWLLATYGLVIGVIIGITTLLNQMLAPVFQHSEEAIGWIGLLNVVTGFLGAYAFGHILDKTHKFKVITLIISFSGVAAVLLFTGLLYLRVLWIQFITVGLLGLFLTGFYPVGFEFASEITYPEPEGIVAGLLNTSTLVFGFITTTVGSYLLQNYSLLVVNLFYLANLLLAGITSCFIKQRLLRSEKNAITNK